METYTVGSGEMSDLPLCIHILLSFYFFHNFIYLFMFGCAGLHCCVGSSLLAVRGLLTEAFPVAEHRLKDGWASVVVAHELGTCGSQPLEHRLSSCGAWLLHGMWDPPRMGIEPVSPALAGGLPTMSHQGSPYHFIFKPYKCIVLFKQLKKKCKSDPSHLRNTFHLPESMQSLLFGPPQPVLSPTSASLTLHQPAGCFPSR